MRDLRRHQRLLVMGCREKPRGEFLPGELGARSRTVLPASFGSAAPPPFCSPMPNCDPAALVCGHPYDEGYALEYEFLPGELGAWTRIPLPASLGPNPPPFFSPWELQFLPGELGAPLGPISPSTIGPDAPHFFRHAPVRAEGSSGEASAAW